MQMDKIVSTAGQSPKAANNIGRSAGNTEVPVEMEKLKEAVESDNASSDKQVKISKEELEQAIESLQEYAGWGNFNIGFDTDDETNSLIIKIVDRESGEMLHQIPSENILKLRSHLREVLGLVFDHLA
ncbi:MAG: flagellar protein FlaG [candidate division Zixibacteria bacterium]|nr:flagellar protein FlaG [candidate division Zixibacteria bacterium]